LPAGTVNLTVSGVVVQTSGQVTPTGGELGSETGANGEPLAIELDRGGQIRSESGGYQFQRNLILGDGGGSLDVGAWNQTFLGLITGNGSLGKFGTGTLVLDNPPVSGWTGDVVLHAGTLQLSRGGSNGLLPGTLDSPGHVTIQSGATLKFFRGSDKSFFDVLSGSGNLVIANANNATVRLVADCTNTGLTTISSGVLMIGQGNPGEPGSIVCDVLNNSVLDFNRVEDVSYGGAISGTGSLVKERAGKLTLTGANTFGGGTTVMAGTLVAANSTGSATGSGTVDVQDGAAVAGIGKMAGLIQLEANAHLAPGMSIGTLTLGALSLAPNSVLDYELGTPASSDLTIVANTGGLTINGGTLNITAGSGFGVGEYPIIDYAGSVSGSIGNLSIGSAPLGYGYSFANNAALTRIDLVVTPEPGTMLASLALVGLLGAGRTRRRRCNRPRP
jgi:autotransporter-associated beta strand protein